MESPDVLRRKNKSSSKMSPLLPTTEDVHAGKRPEEMMIAEPQGGIYSTDFVEEKRGLALAELSSIDRKNFFVLCFLYLLQGIPVGLAFGSVPFLLKSKLSYGQIGLFSFASYPYSLKLLWSPIVDAWYNPRFGRRKSWIVPIQFCSSLVLIWLGSFVEAYIDDAETHLGAITFYFFILVFFSATQDIAVDGWALTLLSQPALSYASTAQTIGLNTGYFLSFTIFLALSSPDFANRWLRSQPLDVGLFTLSQYLTTWGIVYCMGTIAVGLLKKEGRSRSVDEDTSITNVYRTMFKVLKLNNVQGLILVHVFAKLAFQANDAVTNLKLLEKGLSKEDLALTVLIDFPFEIIFGYYAAKWSTGKDPLAPWMTAFLLRMVFCIMSMFTVIFFPKSGAGFGYLLVIIVVHCIGSFLSTVQFVSINAFHTQIADPLIGGTYMTTLNTICNLGGQWPRVFVLYGVDLFTRATCTAATSTTSTKPFEPFSCSSEAGKDSCKTLGGTCTINQDGYYVMNLICIAIGSMLFFSWIKPKMQHLQRLPIESWRVK